ncbi:polyphosphate kinase 1 [Myxococcota bacterium]|nr:polyphosphate kinase 1 [Myxococcota bacterium]
MPHSHTAAPPAPPALTDPSLYVNRELSLLEFNRRVLAQALDPEVPLLERLRFLTICSSNLDEFFEIRIAGLKQRAAAGSTETGPDGLLPEQNLSKVAAVAHKLVQAQYRTLNQELLPALERQGIEIPRRTHWTSKLQRFARDYFQDQVLPVLTPVGLDPVHPFPKVLNKGLNFLITLKGTDAFGRDSGMAVLQVPRCLPRIINLPAQVSGHPWHFVLLSSVIHANVGELFPGMKVTGCHQFRVTRNSDLWVDEEEVANLKQALQGELLWRRYGDAVRLEVVREAPQKVCDFLLRQFGLQDHELYKVDGPVNLHRIGAVVSAVDLPHLKYPPFIPGNPPGLHKEEDYFETIRRQDVLLHHPFQSFNPIIELLRQAARDPEVLAIKQTLYRTGDASPLVEALIEAARAGKVVTVIIELRARFDEAANIELADRLEEVGANVVYGVVGYKCHAKMTLIVRREGGKVRRYTHLGTGNYHAGTARAYTDLGQLTADPKIGRDVHELFMQLTGLGHVQQMNRLLQSPFTLHEGLLEHIRFETEEARAGRPAFIQARMNSLSEPDVIRELYRASQAGVQVDLVVRGICCLRPGVPGVSEQIRVRSIVGRFLEHSRVWRFHHAGEDRIWCTSADWMHRNLDRRIEVAWPVLEPELKRRVVEEALEIYLSDDSQAWLLHADGSYERAPRRAGQEPVSAQTWLLNRFGR